MSKTGEAYPLGCIFKVGDDVRQVNIFVYMNKYTSLFLFFTNTGYRTSDQVCFSIQIKREVSSLAASPDECVRV